MRYRNCAYYTEAFWAVPFSAKKATMVAYRLTRRRITTHIVDHEYIVKNYNGTALENKLTIAYADVDHNKICMLRHPSKHGRRLSAINNNAELWAAFFHELAHLCKPTGPAWHGAKWKNAMRELVEEFERIECQKSIGAGAAGVAYKDLYVLYGRM